jgi:protein TonB
MAGAIYLALAGSGILLSRARAVLPPTVVRTGPPPRLIEVILNPAAPAAAHPAAPATPDPGPRLASPSQAAERALPRDIDPGTIPTGLPTRDLSGLKLPGPTGTALAGTGQATTSEPPGQAQVRFVDVNMVRILHQVTPGYPALARMTHVQGAVVLLMTIDETGAPTEVKVLEGHPGLQEAALQAARQWRFEPARVEGRPVPASFRLTLNFRLQ